MSSYDAKTTHDDLQSYFDGYASNVRRSFSSFENQYARPLLDACIVASRDRPITSTFVAVFALLSFLPVLAFVAYSLLTVAAFTVFALLGLLASSAVALTAYTTVLLTALTILLLTSLFITAFLTSTYFAARLASCVHAHGFRSGFSSWTGEVRGVLIGNERPISSGDLKPREDEQDERGSEGSGVVVKAEDGGAEGS